jgi:hypothetical protein
MKKLIILAVTLIFLATTSFGQFNIDWQQCYGGMGVDVAHDIVPVEGGYLVAGFTNSHTGLVACNPNDYGLLWLIKIDNSGALVWQKCFENRRAYRMFNAIDSPYIFIIGGAYAEPYPNTNNLWVAKIDSLGNIIWERALGNTVGVLGGDEYGEATDDGGVIATGQIDSQGGDITNWWGGYDGWVVKLDSLGNTEWDTSLGSPNFEFINGIIQTSDGGYLAGLYGAPNGAPGTIDCGVASNSNSEAIVVKLNADGEVKWHQCYGGSKLDGVVRLLEVADGYIVAGWGSSDDGDLQGGGYHFGWHHTGVPTSDVWLIKIDFEGNMIWQKCYGGTKGESPRRLFRTADEGIVVFVETDSYDCDVVGNPANTNDNPCVWVFKVDNNGVLQWQQCFGGPAKERVYGVVKHSDYKYTVAGEMNYSPSGDVNCSNFVYGSQQNYWVFGISDTTVAVPESPQPESAIKVYPNPATSVLTIELPETYDLHNAQFSIIEISGKIVLISEAVEHTSQIDIKTIKSGLYLLKIQNDKTLITRRILVY